LDNEWKKASEEINNCKESLQKKSKPLLEILRVNQLDALRLDNEIHDMLSTQYMKMFLFFKSDVVEKFKPELMALLDTLIYWFSIYSVGTTYGNKLQNLRFANAKDNGTISTTQKVVFGVLTVGVKWFWTRLQSFTVPPSNLWFIFNNLEKIYRFATVINFLFFLYDGKYVSLVTRILRMRLIYHSKSVKRTISFEYMNNQLVWHEFTEFLMFIIPLVNTIRLKNFLTSLFSSKIHQNSLPLSACPICTKDPVQTAYQANCGHLFCYYCIKQNCMMDPSYSCPRCGVKIKSMCRYQPKK